MSRKRDLLPLDDRPDVGGVEAFGLALDEDRAARWNVRKLIQ